MPAGNYCCIPGQQKQLVVRMSLRGMSTKDISIATGISARAVSLSELQEALFIAHEGDIDTITISRALYRGGYTRKKV
ncbi:hypothetical protein BDN70DRAFT_886343, partial [Pholiota conissans]